MVWLKYEMKLSAQALLIICFICILFLYSHPNDLNNPIALLDLFEYGETGAMWQLDYSESSRLLQYWFMPT